MSRLRTAALTAATAAVLATGVAAATLEPAPTARAGATLAVSAPAPSRHATAPQIADARAVLPRLRIAPDVLVGARSGYDREARFGTWPYTARGCDLRDVVLADELTHVTYRRGSRCNVAAGALDGRPVSSGDVDIDHVVPLRLAWSSGAAGWTDQRRRVFATDRLNLRVEGSHGNRGNGDVGPERSDPAPGDRVARCRYGTDFVLVAQKYALTVTPARAAALGELLEECPR